MNFWIVQSQPASVRVISSYFVWKSSFRVISMTKMVIFDQTKPISLYLKCKKFKHPKFVNCTFIIDKNGNKISIQPILNRILHLLRSIIFFVR